MAVIVLFIETLDLEGMKRYSKAHIKPNLNFQDIIIGSIYHVSKNEICDGLTQFLKLQLSPSSSFYSNATSYLLMQYL